MKSFVDKYKPKSLKEFIGNNTSIDKLKRTILNKGCALIHGSVGTGKTSSVYALASDLNYEVLEVNASDYRNKDAINSVVGSSLNQMSLFNKGKIILIDEIDGLFGNEDRGGIQAIAVLLENNKHAVVLTAVNPWSYKLNSIRKKCELIEFNKLKEDDTLKFLKKICEEEKIKCNNEVLKRLAEINNGDLRSAINDLQVLSTNKKEINLEDLEIVSKREREQSIFNALKTVFKSRDLNEVLGVFDNVDMDHNEILLWLDENLPSEYKFESLYGAYDKISKADVFNGRIRRWQHWRFLVYIYALISAGVALAKKETNNSFVNYKRTGRILKMWIYKQKNAKKKAIATKLGEELHSSTKEILKNTLPYMRIIAKNNKNIDFGLDEEEIEYLREK